MTIDYKNLTESQERDFRDKAFYLIKKYTSYTFLDQARKSYQGFLNAFAKQLNDPQQIRSQDQEEMRNFSRRMSSGFYEERYQGILKQIIPVEEGLKLLLNTSHKREAFRQILSNDFCGELWGRGADEWGLESDIFYHTLGYYRPPLAVESDEILSVQVASEYFRALSKTASGYAWWLKRRDRTVQRWNFEAFFDSYDNTGGRGWPPISYPSNLPSCPARNTSTEGQVLSGEEIQITGIWEPWFIVSPAKEGVLSGLLDRLSGKPIPPEAVVLTGKVGCPNYFLAGTTAFEYETDGTGDKVKVAWRLLWEDTRYLDGTIPEEESTYFEPQAPAPEQRPVVLTAMPGEPCPESGEWYSVNWEDRKALLKQGEPMPGPQYSKTGVVVWHMKNDVS